MEQLTSSPLDSSETMIGERTARTTAQTLLAPTRTPPSPLTPRSTPPPVQTPPLVTCTNNESSTTYRTANATQCCPNPPKRKSTIRKSQSRAAGIHNNHNHNRPSRCLDSFLDERCKISRTMMLRTVLIGSLLTAAAACASLAYITLRNAETNTAVATYESVAASALDNAKTIATRKFQASEVTASIASWTHPNADEWPFIFINGYINITQKIADLAQSSTQAMIVFIDVNQTQQFEQHLKDTYAIEGRPPETGVSRFGFGIWKPDPNLTFPDGRLHDTTGEVGTQNIHNITGMHSVSAAPKPCDKLSHLLTFVFHVATFWVACCIALVEFGSLLYLYNSIFFFKEHLGWQRPSVGCQHFPQYPKLDQLALQSLLGRRPWYSRRQYERMC